MKWIIVFVLLGASALSNMSLSNTSLNQSNLVIHDPEFQTWLDKLKTGQDIEDALGHLDRVLTKYVALEGDHPNASGYIRVGEVLTQIKRIDIAERYASRAEAMSPEAVGTLLLMGWVRFNQANLEDAHKYYTRAVQLYPQSPNTHHNLGHTLGALKRHEESIASFEKAIEIQPNKSTYSFAVGEAYEKTQQRDKAIAAFRRVLTLTEGKKARDELWNRQRSFWNLGKLLGTQSQRLQKQGGDPGELARMNTEAEAMFLSSLRLHATDGDALTEYGMYLMKGSRFPEAITQLRKAVENNSAHRWAHYQLGIALNRTGEREEGKKMMARFKELQADFERQEFELLLTKIRGPSFDENSDGKTEKN